MKRSPTFVVALLMALASIGSFSAQTTPAAATPEPPVVLREDHQVIQRNESNVGVFQVALVDATATDTYLVKITGSNNAKVLERKVKASPSVAGGQTVDVGGVPVG